MKEQQLWILSGASKTTSNCPFYGQNNRPDSKSGLNYCAVNITSDVILLIWCGQLDYSGEIWYNIVMIERLRGVLSSYNGAKSVNSGGRQMSLSHSRLTGIVTFVMLFKEKLA